MYTTLEYICTIVSVMNLITALVIYIIDRKQGVSINSGKHFQSFKTCITMSVLFGVLSMCVTFNNLHHDNRIDQ